MRTNHVPAYSAGIQGMVHTRQRARLEAAKVHVALRKTATKGADNTTSDHGHSYEGEAEQQTSASVEELALQAFAKIKERLTKDRGSSTSREPVVSRERRSHGKVAGGTSEDDDASSGAETEQQYEEQPQILLFDTKATSSSKKVTPAGQSVRLASSLDPGIQEDLYFSFDEEAIVSSACHNLAVGDVDRELMKRSVITPDFEKRESAPPIHQSRFALQKIRKAERARSLGRQWFDLPAPQLTPELKNDLRIIKMRNALDPAQHYKANDSKELPKYFQVGHVISGPTDFYSSRIPKRQRKQTIVEELLADGQFKRYQKKKYYELQQKFMSGRRRYKRIKHRKKYKK